MSGSYEPFALSTPGVDSAAPARRPRPKTWGWLAAGIVVVMLVTVIMGLGGKGIPDGPLAEQIGYAVTRSAIGCLLLALIVMFPIWLFGLRKRAPDRQWPYFRVLAMVAFGLGMTISAADILVGSVRTENRLIVAMVRESVTEGDALVAAAIAEANEVDIEALLTPQALSTAAGRRRASAELDRREEIITQMVVFADHLVAKFRGRVSDHFTNDRRRKTALAEFDRQTETGRARLNEAVEVQRALYINMRELIALLGSARWQPMNGIFAFDRAQDMNRFNRIIADIQQQEAKLTGLVAEADVRTQAYRRQLEQAEETVRAPGRP